MYWCMLVNKCWKLVNVVACLSRIIMENPLPFHTPCSIVVSAASSCGKTQLVAKILDHLSWCFDKPTRRVIYCYAHHQDVFEKLEKDHENITFHNCLPTEDILEEISDPTHHDLLILDDFAKESGESGLIESLFVRGSHHTNVSVILLTQNLYHNTRFRRTQALNTHYNLFLRNPMGIDQIATFARQRFQGRSKAFLETYLKVTTPLYSYLLVDSHPRSDPTYSVRTGVFPRDELIVYQFP